MKAEDSMKRLEKLAIKAEALSRKAKGQAKPAPRSKPKRVG